jgi:PhnB protein
MCQGATGITKAVTLGLIQVMRQAGLDFKKSNSRMKSATITSYLSFSGNCREAMQFYKECLGGELWLQTIADSPLGGKLPPALQHYILQGTLINKSLSLMGSDITPTEGLKKGNSVSLMLQCSSEEEIKTCYTKLAAGGQAEYLPSPDFRGVLVGGLTDKFGHHWLLRYEYRAG